MQNVYAKYEKLSTCVAYKGMFFFYLCNLFWIKKSSSTNVCE